MGHRAASGTRVVALPNGVRVSHPVDTWAMLGQTLTVDDLIVMGDGLLRRKNPLATLANLEAALETRRGCRGYRNLAAALPHVRARTDSARETIVRLIVIRAGFPEPEVNAAITDAFGTVIAHGDLTFRRYRVIVEYDGGQHRDDEYQFNIDIERLDRLMEEGWRVIRVNKQLLAQRAALVGKIRTALKAGGWRGEP